ncbi:GNAT family N-acetyltransferase [Kitasatospora sp. NPDC093679]|uniref:GNAT family N-acetyltransferase n=1 Tax=unclassified Kitasatospora TaxID=2633591 RepID=UPI003447ECB8
MTEPALDAAELTTDHLVLRRPVPADVAAILAVHRDPRTCRHNPSDALRTRAEAEWLYRRWDERWQRSGFGYWVVRGRGAEQPLGFCGVKPTVLGGLRGLNLFYRFDPACWGRGVAGEAATAVVAWAGRELPRLPLIARIRPENLASQRVAEKAGLTRAAHLDEIGEDGLDWIWARNLP